MSYNSLSLLPKLGYPVWAHNKLTTYLPAYLLTCLPKSGRLVTPYNGDGGIPTRVQTIRSNMLDSGWGEDKGMQKRVQWKFFVGDAIERVLDWYKYNFSFFFWLISCLNWLYIYIHIKGLTSYSFSCKSRFTANCILGFRLFDSIVLLVLVTRS